MAKCGQSCELYSRIVGYFAPVKNWNRGKKEEWNSRKSFVVNGRTCPHVKIKNNVEDKT